MAALNAVPKVLPTRPDTIARNEGFGPLSRAASRQDMTGTALARGTQAANAAEAQPGHRVRQALGAEHFQPPPKPPRLMPELYSTGDLADALGMSDPGVVRRWIKDGQMPEATLWTEGDTMRAGIGVKGHTSTSRKRRYTAAQFGAITRIAIEERVASRSVTGHPRVLSIRDTMFTQRVFTAFERIAAEEASA
jgi:hypothetical protein